MLRKQAGSQREDNYNGQLNNQRLSATHLPIFEYIHLLRSQIRSLGSQIDLQFDRASQFIFSLYKHLYSPSQCQGEKATLLNKLSSSGVQWGLQSALQSKPEEPEVKSEEAKSLNPNAPDNKDQENNKKAYNIRTKTAKPQKYRYGMEDEYDYGERVGQRGGDGLRRGRPTASRRQVQIEPKRQNPYEKAPYKKRKPSPITDGLAEQPKEQISMKNDSSSQKLEGQESLKDIQDGDNAEQGNDDKDMYENKPIDQEAKVGGFQEGEKRIQDDKPISELVEMYHRSWKNCRLQIVIEQDD